MRIRFNKQIIADQLGTTLVIEDGKTFIVENSITLIGNDGSELDIGFGGRLGLLAFKDGLDGGDLSGLSTTGTGAFVLQDTPIINSPALAGNPTSVTQLSSDNSTRIATTAYVKSAINDLVNGAPALLDTLGEIAAQLASDESAISAITTSLANKQPLNANLTAISGLTSAADKVPYFTGSGSAAVTTLTSFGRLLIACVDAAAANVILGGGSGSVTSVAATQPSAGFTISGSPITSTGTFVFTLSDDLAAVEGLSGTGITARTASNTWTTRTLTGTADQVTVMNGDGVSGDPTFSLPQSIATTSSPRFSSLGVGLTGTIMATFESRATSGAQIAGSYNASNFWTATTASDGATTFDAMGLGASFTFSDSVILSSTLNGNTITTGTGTLTLSSYTLTVSGTSSINQNVTTTGTPQFAAIGVGTAAVAYQGIRTVVSLSGGTTQTGIVSSVTGSSGATTALRGVYAGVQTTAAAFTCDTASAFWAQAAVAGSGSTITNCIGFDADVQTAGSTLNASFRGANTAASGVWNLYMTGDAANYFAGGLQIGHNGTALGTFESRATSGAQIVGSYNGSSYWTASTSSTGVTTFTPFGSGSCFIFAGSILLSGLTSNGFVKTSGGNGMLSVDTSTYLTANQIITLSGDVSGSGSTAITTTIGAGKVTNAMLAGSIAASNLVGTDIATVGTITTGTWHASIISITYGGTGQSTAYAALDALTVKGADIASASTTDLSTTTGDFVVVTGTTTITSFGTAPAGVQRTLKFSGALTLTYNATSLILPGATNLVTAAGDTAIFRSLGSGNWQCIAYAVGSAAPWSGSGAGTVTLTGDVTGSGTGTITTTIGASKVTNTMLAGSITAANLVGTDIATVGTITTGTWHGTAVGVLYGGTGQTSYTDGQLLIGNTTGNTLTKATLTGTADQVVVTNGHGSITLSLPQSIATTSLVTFNNVTATNTIDTPSISHSGQILLNPGSGNWIRFNGAGSGGQWAFISSNGDGFHLDRTDVNDDGIQEEHHTGGSLKWLHGLLGDGTNNFVLLCQATGTAAFSANGTTGVITLYKPNISSISNLTSNGFVKTSGGDGTLSVDTSTYLTANQTITLSGDVSGSGSTAITTTIGAGKVTNTMLAGSIAASNLVGTDIATVGTITTGTWHGSVVGPVYGGTGLSSYTLGDILYASATNTLAALAGNTTTTNKFLTQTGTGAVSAAPAWAAIANGDIPSALTGKTYDGLTITSTTGTLTIAAGKTLTVSNTITFTATDGSTLAIGTGGILGSAAYTSSSAYEVALTFSTGLTRTVNTITVDTTQNITKLSNLTSNGFVKTSGGDGTLSVDTSTYLTANQTITLSGDVSGSGSTAITTTIGAGKVTNTMLAGSIAASNLVGTDIATVGTITTGTWNGTAIGVLYGGTGQTSYTDGQLLIGNTTGNTLTKATLTGTADQVVVTNGHGSITLSLPQSIATTSNVQFGFVTAANLTVTNAATIQGITVGAGLGGISGCVGIGAGALATNISGTRNVAVGNTSLEFLTTGVDNVSIGGGAGENIVGGGHNVFVGTDAAKLVNAGTSATAISTSVVIGDAARVLGSSDTNAIVIGSDGRGEGSNTTVIGNSSTTACHLYGTLKIGDGTDSTKTATFDCASITTSTNRTFTFPDASGTLVLGGGTCSGTSSGTNTGDQTITLSGDISGSGTGAITTTIGSGKVTNAMLAGSIAASNLVGTDIATVGTITTGTWHGTAIDTTYGGTGLASYVLGDILYASAANTLSALAGNTTTTNKFLAQTGTGAVSAAPVWAVIADGDVPSALTGKTYNGLTITSTTGTLTIAAGKTLTASNTITFTATDGSTLAIGTGGTLGTAAYTASSAYEVPVTFSTGLTRTVNTVTVNTTQNITRLSNLTSNGFVKTGSANGTLSVAASVADSEIDSALTGKTYNGLTITSTTGTLTIAAGKTLTASNTITFTATDGSTLAIGTGGTLGTAAYTASSAYEVPVTFSTGLTRTVNTVTVNTTQNITRLSNLTSNGFVKTSGGTGTLSIDTSTYLTTNQTITLSGDISGSGTTAITTAIGTGKVTNLMLANSAITIGTTSISLGSSSTVLAGMTSITDALLIGGTSTTSTLTLQSTSGTGTTGADIIFKVGTNGATEAARITNAANFGVGTGSTVSAKLHVIKTTEQLRVGYDASNYLSFTVSSTGSIAALATGTGGQWVFSNSAGGTTPALLVNQLAAAAAAEAIAKFMVSDDTSYLLINNATSNDAVFAPRFQGYQSSTNIALNFTGVCQTDSGTNPAVYFAAQTNGGGNITTRPLVQFVNLSTVALEITGGYNIRYSGPGTTPTLASLVADSVLLCAVDSAANDRNLYARNEEGHAERLTGRSCRTTSGVTATSSTVLANVTGLTRNVEASGVYGFIATLYTTSNSASGVKFAISGTATATSVVYECVVTEGAALKAQTRATTLGTAVGAVTAVTAAYVTITGTIVVNAAGTLTVQFAQNVSGGSASTILTNSTFELITIGA